MKIIQPVCDITDGAYIGFSEKPILQGKLCDTENVEDQRTTLTGAAT